MGGSTKCVGPREPKRKQGNLIKRLKCHQICKRNSCI